MSDDTKIVELKTKQQKEKEQTEKELVELEKIKDETKEMVLEAIANQLPSSKGIVAITFDEDDNPRFNYGGVLNNVQVIGSIELFKTILLEAALEGVYSDEPETDYE